MSFGQHLHNKIQSILPYREMKDVVLVIFHFSSMSPEEAGRIHDLLESSISCPNVDPEKKTASGTFFIKRLDVPAIIATVAAGRPASL